MVSQLCALFPSALRMGSKYHERMVATMFKHALAVGAIALGFTLGMGFSAHAEISTVEVYDLVNEYRAENGLGALVVDESLSGGATIRARESSEVWSHTRPDGSDWWTVDTRLYGENLGYGYDTASELVNAWIASPSHNANLLGNFGTVCVSTYVDANGVECVAQEFGL